MFPCQWCALAWLIPLTLSTAQPPLHQPFHKTVHWTRGPRSMTEIVHTASTDLAATTSAQLPSSTHDLGSESVAISSTSGQSSTSSKAATIHSPTSTNKPPTTSRAASNTSTTGSVVQSSFVSSTGSAAATNTSLKLLRQTHVNMNSSDCVILKELVNPCTNDICACADNVTHSAMECAIYVGTQDAITAYNDFLGKCRNQGLAHPTETLLVSMTAVETKYTNTTPGPTSGAGYTSSASSSGTAAADLPTGSGIELVASPIGTVVPSLISATSMPSLAGATQTSTTTSTSLISLSTTPSTPPYSSDSDVSPTSAYLASYDDTGETATELGAEVYTDDSGSLFTSYSTTTMTSSDPNLDYIRPPEDSLPAWRCLPRRTSLLQSTGRWIATRPIAGRGTIRHW